VSERRTALATAREPGVVPDPRRVTSAFGATEPCLPDRSWLTRWLLFRESSTPGWALSPCRCSPGGEVSSRLAQTSPFRAPPRRSGTAASKHNCVRSVQAQKGGRYRSSGEAALCCRRDPRVAILHKRGHVASGARHFRIGRLGACSSGGFRAGAVGAGSAALPAMGACRRSIRAGACSSLRATTSSSSRATPTSTGGATCDIEVLDDARCGPRVCA
jgi:hypothetical protein